jgi:hypothetical protein
MKRNRIAVLIVATSFAGFLGLGCASADVGDKSPPVVKSSEVNSPISCGAAAQKKFNQAVWILHSFWYDEAIKAFTTVTATEPDCAMGYGFAGTRAARRFAARAQ